MDDVQFNNWKQTIEETLARVSIMNEQAAERHKEWEVQWKARADAADRRMDRFERNLAMLARLGLKARSRLNRRQEEHDANMARIELTMAEITDKLNGLIGHVEGQHPPQH